jgi:hypothetical protein
MSSFDMLVKNDVRSVRPSLAIVQCFSSRAVALYRILVLLRIDFTGPRSDKAWGPLQ